MAYIYTVDLVVTHNLTNHSINNEKVPCVHWIQELLRKVALYLTGYIKPIYDQEPGIKNGIVFMKFGPSGLNHHMMNVKK